MLRDETLAKYNRQMNILLNLTITKKSWLKYLPPPGQIPHLHDDLMQLRSLLVPLLLVANYIS